MNDQLNDNETTNGNQGDMLDVVGRGYLSNYDVNFGQENFEQNQTQEEYRLSSSFCSRIRQKTMERDEEKQKKKKKKELENLNTNLSLQSPNPSNEFENQKADFGLSISGYPSGKMTLNQNLEFDEEKKSKYSTYDLTNLDFLEAEYDSPSANLPSLDKPKFQPTKATQARIKARQAASEAAKNETLANETAQENLISSPVKTRKKVETIETDAEIVTRVVKEDFVKQPFKNPESAFKEAMNYLSQDNWENKCNAMNIIRRLSVYHEDIVVENIHPIVIALVQEVKNLRSQVSRFALVTFGELFVNLKKNMDVDLDIAVKTILQKLSETNEFIRVDIEKCLEKMINNVTTTKAIIALINGGASHRNPVIRRVAAQYVYKSCEIMGPGRILSGIKDVTEKVLVTAAQFVVDGPVDIRWYGRKIFHILMSHDEFDRLLVKYLNEKTRKNIKEILDTVRVKGPGEVPTESARNSRKVARVGSDLITRSAGSNTNMDRAGTVYGISEPRPLGSRPNYPPPLPPSLRIDQQSQEYVKSLCAQMRNADFRERMDAIEKFQVLCEQEPEMAIANLVQIFDKFNLCLTESNSKVNYKALNTMYLITPLLRDDLNPVLVNVIPLIAHNLASKNSEIQDMASNILDALVEYLVLAAFILFSGLKMLKILKKFRKITTRRKDKEYNSKNGGSLIQPFTNIAIHGNARVKPQIILKLSDLVSKVYQRKQKQVDMHILPALWQILNLVKGNTMSAGINSLNFSITKLVMSLYEQMGEQLIEKASNNSSVSTRNLETLKQILTSQLD
ncbi:hypothetical protein BpHYR1_050751 [Brachionus plicatilis]|uniref:TOG domain-containing protein n=1 Tax=Brachionus plicatilis TaxID=10195 RepID=A0A3M7P9H4_BRAPC|nr:hypothetical protein BpHYR1_050751 [Brachionus plicatilis]